MLTVNLDTGLNVKVLVFPDSQPHVQIENIHVDSRIKVICSITSPTKLLTLLETANAITNAGAICSKLVIPYLLGARYDRMMGGQIGESFDLEVIAGLINSMHFEEIFLYDVHSNVSLKLIHNSVMIDNKQLVMEYNRPDAVLIVPDKGAEAKAKDYLQWNRNLVDTVYCGKKRDEKGKIDLTVWQPYRCSGRNCVIIDDICDGGSTFLAIANQIQPKHLTLIVTHGIFSKGLKHLIQRFHQIITSNTLEHSEYTAWQFINQSLRFKDKTKDSEAFLRIIEMVEKE